MRRVQSSSSCLLRPRSSLSLAELSQASGHSFSVTVLNTNPCTTAPVERFYALSEIRDAAKTVQFLNEDEAEDNDTTMTDAEELEEDDDDNDEINNDMMDDPSTLNDKKTKPHFILYLLWGDETYVPDPDIFLEQTIKKAVTAMYEMNGSSIDLDEDLQSSAGISGKKSLKRAHVSYASMQSLSIPDSSVPMEIGFDIASTIESPTAAASTATTEAEKDKKKKRRELSVYLVIERVARFSEEDCDEDDDYGGDFPSESETAECERLGRLVSSNRPLRNALEGLTIGLAVSPGESSRGRFIPALEVAVKAFEIGAAERRKYARSPLAWFRPRNRSVDSHTKDDPLKSEITLVCRSAADLLGIDGHTSEPDAVEGGFRALTVGEWRHKGNLLSFAERAMDDWRSRHGLETCEESMSRNQRQCEERKRFRKKLKEKFGLNKQRIHALTTATEGTMEANDLANVFVIFAIVALAAHLWSQYGDLFIRIVGDASEQF